MAMVNSKRKIKGKGEKFDNRDGAVPRTKSRLILIGRKYYGERVMAREGETGRMYRGRKVGCYAVAETVAWR